MASFLLGVLSDESTSVTERSTAFLRLVDRAPEVLAVMTADERSLLLAELDRHTAAMGSSWSVAAQPDPAVCPPDSVEGVNVPVAVISGGGGAQAALAVVPLPRGGPVVVDVEYSYAGAAGDCEVVVAGDRGEELGRVVVDAGVHAVASLDLVVDAPVALSVAVMNRSDESFRFFGSTAASPSVEPSLQPLRDALVELSKNEAAPIFGAVTGEPLTLADIDRFSELRNKFAGERIFVMGNGPSLNRTPLEMLENEFVFGVNRISLLFERVDWRPTFYTAFDVRVVPDNRDEFRDLDLEYKFFSARYKSLMGERDNHFWYHTKGFYEGFDAAFEPTVPYSGFGGGGTIGVMAIEIAFFLGFREIYLIGTDVSYSIPSTAKQAGPDSFGDGVGLELTSTKDDDQNHFDPRYFGAGKKWHNPNVREMKIGFGRAAASVERRGGSVRNATIGGELDTVERVDFHSLF